VTQANAAIRISPSWSSSARRQSRQSWRSPNKHQARGARGQRLRQVGIGLVSRRLGNVGEHLEPVEPGIQAEALERLLEYTALAVGRSPLTELTAQGAGVVVGHTRASGPG
jgi:hypothetical protein